MVRTMRGWRRLWFCCDGHEGIGHGFSVTVSGMSGPAKNAGLATDAADLIIDFAPGREFFIAKRPITGERGLITRR